MVSKWLARFLVSERAIEDLDRFKSWLEIETTLAILSILQIKLGCYKFNHGCLEEEG